jgi:hypothetical protein
MNFISFSIQRRVALALLLLLGSIGTGFGVTLVPQEQAIADSMVNNPAQGRPCMVLDPIIEGVARARAKDMAVRNYFSHVNPDGVAANYLLRQAGYQLPAWWGTDPTANYVESIASGSPSASVTWTAWMNSPDHKTHLLAQNSFFATETHYGVGYYYDPNSTYQYYWVVITAPPQPIAIATPVRGAVVTGSSVAVAGSVDPAAGAASVQFRVENASGTRAYQAAAGTTSWSGTAGGLIGGSNLIRAQSLDGSGNVLAETTCTIGYIVEGTLTVTLSGSGCVTPGFAGVTTQQVGKAIALRATPAPGSIFTGWTGAMVSSKATITFPMENGLNLEANFEPNPFVPLAGAYGGLLTTGSGVSEGVVRLTVSAGGVFTGGMVIGGKAWALTGALDANGDATVIVPNPGAAPWTVSLQADLGGGDGEITGTVSGGDDAFGFTISQSSYAPGANAAPEAGRYTVVFAPDPAVTGTSAPAGDGYATIVVDASGGAIVAGRLADGTAYSANGRVADDGTLALYFVPSGAPAGSSVSGVLTFGSSDVSDLDGTLAWTRAACAGAPVFSDGFAEQLQCVGSRYARPVVGLEAMDESPGAATAAFGAGGLAQTINVPVVLTPAETAAMVNPGAPNVTLGINANTGVVSGSFVLPGGGGIQAVSGVVLQKQNSGFGFFRGAKECGSFSLVPGA